MYGLTLLVRSRRPFLEVREGVEGARYVVEGVESALEVVMGATQTWLRQSE